MIGQAVRACWAPLRYGLDGFVGVAADLRARGAVGFFATFFAGEGAALVAVLAARLAGALAAADGWADWRNCVVRASTRRRRW